MTATAAHAIRARAAGENFSVAPLLLGRATAARLHAIYDFARLVDELGDSAEGDRLRLLDDAEAELDRAFAGEAAAPVFRALEPLIADCSLPRGPFVRLIDANRRDQLHPELATYEELLDYCTLSANPVGELVLHVFGAATPERVALSDSVCTGLQLVEHWQDVAEDARNGRVYLPAEDRERFGVEREQLVAPHASERLRRLLAFECDRADELLAAGSRLVASLSGRARLAVAGYVGGGRANLAAIRRAGYDVLPGAPKAGKLARARQTLLALRGAG
ncbi:MAG TPA: squalene synthase HpnC [Gaiellaceae bacterium]|nr:squalene synthase HpnC [Gaiellaceae bacterium]